VAVTGLGLPELAVRLSGPRCLDGIHGVGLTFTPAFLAVGAVHLDHVHPGPAQIAGQTSTIRTGALHPDTYRFAEASQPAQQGLVARRRGLELLHPQQATDTVQGSGHMHLEVGVHTTRYRARSIYDCHSHPFL